MVSGSGFVDGLPLEMLGTRRLWRSDDSSALLNPEARQSNAYVVAASVVTFADGVVGQQKEDLLNSTLLAQLAANNKADREKDTPHWYEAYRAALYGVFWQNEGGILGGAPSPTRLAPITPPLGGGVAPRPGLPPLVMKRPPLPFNRVVPIGPRFTIQDVAQTAVRSADGEKMASAVAGNLARLSQLPDRDRRAVIFETSSHSSGRGNFQIVAVSSDADQVLRMTIVAMFFSTESNVPRVTSFSFGRTMQVYQARDRLMLHSADYASVRQSVIARLGDQATAYIAELSSD